MSGRSLVGLRVYVFWKWMQCWYRSKAWYWITQDLNIHLFGVPFNRASPNKGVGMSGTVYTLKLICLLLFPAGLWQLWSLYILAIQLWLGQISWTDMSLFFSKVLGFSWGPLGNASGLVHIQVEWLSNIWEGQGWSTPSCLFQVFNSPLLSLSQFQGCKSVVLA